MKSIFRLKKKPSAGFREAPVADSSTESSPHNESPLMSAETSAVSSTTSSSSSLHQHSTKTNAGTVYEQYTLLGRRPDFPQELTPIVTLLTCQAARIYAEGFVLLNVELNGSNEHDDDLFFQPAEALLRGSSLLLSPETGKSITLDLLEATIHVQEQHTSLVLSTSHRAAHHLKFADFAELQHWLAAIYLAIYEYTSLSQCYTASLLSAKATQLSDVHVVMGELKYTKEEWVNIKFSKNAQWLRCYMTITPGSSKNRGTVNFYSSQRTVKKNLICSLSSVDHCHAVYPSVIELIDSSALIRVQGDVTLYNLGSESSPLSSPIRGSRPSSPQAHNRHTSVSSVSSLISNSSSKSTKGFHVHRTSLYILPQQHGGVRSYETMIRVLMPLYDAFKLYGRPKKLIPDKRNEQSLLFGLPALPKVKILTSKMALALVTDNWSLLSTDTTAYSQLFDTQLKTLYNTDSSYGGYGDLRESMQKASGFEHPFSRRMSISSSTIDASPKYALSLSDLPSGLSDDALEQIQNKSSAIKSVFTPKIRSPSFNSPHQHSRRTSRASALRTESYSNLNTLMDAAHIS